MSPRPGTSSTAATPSSSSARTQSLRTSALTRKSVATIPSENQSMLMRWACETRPNEMTYAEQVEKEKWEKAKEGCAKE
ncbi:hypothetical protein Plec18167_003292 [Paecilomyces lecythidis]|uniref:Uncharacterized protein n=1 Tax=Paecilomyces lecythidis TaxID=3004212 RepID=A0ABR3Y096_9EURO